MAEHLDFSEDEDTLKIGEERVFIDNPANGGSGTISVTQLKQIASGKFTMSVKEMRDKMMFLSQALLKFMGE